MNGRPPAAAIRIPARSRSQNGGSIIAPTGTARPVDEPAKVRSTPLTRSAVADGASSIPASASPRPAAPPAIDIHVVPRPSGTELHVQTVSSAAVHARAAAPGANPAADRFQGLEIAYTPVERGAREPPRRLAEVDARTIGWHNRRARDVGSIHGRPSDPWRVESRLSGDCPGEDPATAR